MRMIRGNYPGASKFLHFDTDLNAMTRKQMTAILSKLLQYGNPISGLAERDVIYRALSDAEESMKEGA